ncbi:MAG: DUF120 domain-containing protein [Nanoarchaeota archaeon]|nr:DUF120 domain-containing protein [Nanoarchaeota archaeon]
MKLLLHLAKKGALSGQVEFSTTRLAKETGLSQQSVSRKLIALEENKLIERQATPQGVRVRILVPGAEVLRAEYSALKEVLSGGPSSLKGAVMHGLGEGAYYMGLKGYVDQFKSLLGFVPYPGTLNLKMEAPSLQHFLVGKEKIVIAGFTLSGRTFGGLDAYPVSIKNMPCALIIPHRTSHNPDVAEIISKEYLRGKLKLKDNDTVEVKP